MAWIKVAGGSANQSQLDGFLNHLGTLYVGSGPTTRLLQFDGVSAFTELTSSALGGATEIQSLRFSSERNRIIGTAQSRVDTYEPGITDWEGAAPTEGFNGEILDITGAGVFAFGGIAVNSRWIVRTDGTNAVIVSNQLALGNQISYSIVFGGMLYVSTILGELWRWNAVNLLTQVSVGIGEAIRSMIVFNAKLYCVTNAGKLYEWDNVSAWILKANVTDSHTDLRKLCIHAGELYVCSGSAWLMKWDGVSAWIKIYAKNKAFEIRDIISFGGVILGAGYEATPSGNVGLMTLVPDYDISVTGIPTSEAFGSPRMTELIVPSSIVTSEAFGSSTISREDIIFPNGIVSVEAWGNLNAATESIILPDGITSHEAFGLIEIINSTKVISGLPPIIEDKEGDIRLVFDETLGYADIELSDRDAVRDAGFETAVLLTLGSDRRADTEDSLPDSDGYKGGYWGDDIPPVEGDKFGWKGWLLRRSKTDKAVISQCKDFLIEGFQWMKDDGIISEVLVNVSRFEENVLLMELQFIRPNQENIYMRFYYNWEAQILRRG